MKKLTLFILMCCMTARAQFTYNAYYLIITNAPTNGQTITISGSTSTWTNSPILLTQIQTTNVIGWAASNLFNQSVSHFVPGVRVVSPGTSVIPTNGVGFAGDGITVTASAGWCQITNTSASSNDTLVVRVQSGTIAGVPTNQNIVASSLVKGISDNSTQAFATASTTMSNFVSLTAAQTVSGAKIFSASAQQWISGIVSNTVLTNCVAGFSNGVAVNLTLTNGNNFGAAFRSSGGGLYSEQFGYQASANSDYGVALGAFATANGIGDKAVGNNVILNGLNVSGFGYAASAQADYASAFGALANASLTNSTAIGQNSSATQTNQVRLGIASGTVSIPGSLEVDGSISNATFAGNITANGTNTFNGAVAFTRKNNTSLANGNNAAVDISTNVYVKVSGPTGAFAINGFNGGYNGRKLILENATGQTLTIANDSGVDPTAANRIYTGTGADVALTNNPSLSTFYYDSASSHWVFSGGGSSGSGLATTTLTNILQTIFTNATGIAIYTNVANGQLVISNSAGASAGTVTSVGLTMPAGFVVGSSPVTTSGTIAVTGHDSAGLLAANNLSDIGTAATALSNLGGWPSSSTNGNLGFGGNLTIVGGETNGGNSQVGGNFNVVGTSRLNGNVVVIGTLGMSSKLSAASGIGLTTAAKSGNYAFTVNDTLVTESAAGSTLTLPTASGGAGFNGLFIAKNISSGNVTLTNANGSQTIDNGLQVTIVPQESVSVLSDGSNWQIIGQTHGMINTNFVLGTLYTNTYGCPVTIGAFAGLTTAAVTGDSALQLQMPGNNTNTTGLGTTVAVTLAMTYTNEISGVVTNLGTYKFVDGSAGAGNSSAVVGGQISW